VIVVNLRHHLDALAAFPAAHERSKTNLEKTGSMTEAQGKTVFGHYPGNVPVGGEPPSNTAELFQP